VKSKLHTIFLTAVLSVCSYLSSTAQASSFEIDRNTTIVGTPRSVLSKFEDTIYSLALKYKVGAAAFTGANPDVDPLLPGEGIPLQLPGQYILPAVEREGIVVNLPEMRLYYFPRGENTVHIYPVGIGRQGWETPTMNAAITSITENPVWTPPESIHQEYRAAGLTLPERVASGPDNPLGKFALRVGHTSYLIHGTNKPAGVGLRVSHGCIRLYPDHIAELAANVDVDTPVNIINQPIKLGRIDGTLHIQANRPADGVAGPATDDIKRFMKLAETTLSAAELESVKNVMLDAFNDGSLYSGLVIPVRSVR